MTAGKLWECPRQSVKAIAVQLQQQAIPTCLDEWNLVPGRPWVDELGKALQECAGCVVFVGPGGARPWHHEELRFVLNLAAKEPKYVLVPVLLPGATRERLSELPGFLTNRTWVEFPKGLDDPDAIHDALVAYAEAPGRAILRHSGSVTSAAFSADGQRVVTASYD
jgi:hypothetical protein